MSNQLNQSKLLMIMLGGGTLFVIAAVCVVGIILLRTPAGETAPVIASVAEVAEAPVSATPENDPASAKVENTPTSLPATATATSSPHPTSTNAQSPTETPGSSPVAGDQLLLPTATPTLSSTPTTTPTPTPTPRPPATLPQQTEGLRVGNIAPDFTLGSNLASRVSLSDLRGKIVVLNFWTTWCPSCRHEVPALQAVHHEYGPRGVVVLAVNVKEPLDRVGKFAIDHGISFNVWLDEDGWASNIYGVRSIPVTYFIDQKGVIRAVYFGSLSRDQIVNQLEKLL